MGRRLAVAVILAAVAGFMIWGIVAIDAHRDQVYADSYWLGYSDALGRNPLAGVPERYWDEVTAPLVEECADAWESSADPGWPHWEGYCAGQWAGWADRLRGSYQLERRVSWRGYDAD